MEKSLALALPDHPGSAPHDREGPFGHVHRAARGFRHVGV